MPYRGSCRSFVFLFNRPSCLICTLVVVVTRGVRRQSLAFTGQAFQREATLTKKPNPLSVCVHLLRPRSVICSHFACVFKTVFLFLGQQEERRSSPTAILQYREVCVGIEEGYGKERDEWKFDITRSGLKKTRTQLPEEGIWVKQACDASGTRMDVLL